MNRRRSEVSIDDDDDESIGGAYERGHWEWDLHAEALLFVSDPRLETEDVVVPSYRAPIGTIEFKDNVDIIDQIRFRRRFQRKVKREDPDVVTLQDLKDIALFTAPKSILSAKLINILHVPTTERLIRALILYSQYYLQMVDVMERRTVELETKIRSHNSVKIEEEYKENLNDLRVLAAKEYTVMLTELEVNRLFKSELFNSTEHTLKTGYLTNMTKDVRDVLIGPCLAQASKLKSRSPVTNELYCKRFIDYRLLGIGVIKNPKLSPRLKHLLLAVAGPEEEYIKEGVTVGILGMKRQDFDIMLNARNSIKTEHTNKTTGYFSNKSSLTSLATKKSDKNMILVKLYPDIELPPKENDLIDQNLPFIDELETVKVREDNEMQRRRWQERVLKILRGRADSRIAITDYGASPSSHLFRNKITTIMSVCRDNHWVYKFHEASLLGSYQILWLL